MFNETLPPMPASVCPYDYDDIAATRSVTILAKRLICAARLYQVFRPMRGQSRLSDSTGGWNKDRSQKTSDGRRRLNLGCGQANYIGYTNLDIVRWGHIHAQASGDTLPFASQSFDEVLCSDVIEHLDPDQASRMFSEVSRVLKTHGRFIAVTPDLNGIVRAVSTQNIDHHVIVQHLLGDQRDHRYLYTIPLLSKRISDAGLRVQRTISHWGPIWAHMVILSKK